MKSKFLKHFAVAFAVFAVVFAFAQSGFAAVKAHAVDSVQNVSSPVAADSNAVLAGLTDIDLTCPLEFAIADSATEQAATAFNPPDSKRVKFTEAMPDIRKTTFIKHFPDADGNGRMPQRE